MAELIKELIPFVAFLWILYYAVLRMNAAIDGTHDDYWMENSRGIQGFWETIRDAPRTYAAFSTTSWTPWQRLRIALGLRVWINRKWHTREQWTN